MYHQEDEVLPVPKEGYDWLALIHSMDWQGTTPATQK